MKLLQNRDFRPQHPTMVSFLLIRKPLPLLHAEAQNISDMSFFRIDTWADGQENWTSAPGRMCWCRAAKLYSSWQLVFFELMNRCFDGLALLGCFSGDADNNFLRCLHNMLLLILTL